MQQSLLQQSFLSDRDAWAATWPIVVGKACLGTRLDCQQEGGGSNLQENLYNVDLNKKSSISGSVHLAYIATGYMLTRELN